MFAYSTVLQEAPSVGVARDSLRDSGDIQLANLHNGSGTAQSVSIGPTREELSLDSWSSERSLSDILGGAAAEGSMAEPSLHEQDMDEQEHYAPEGHSVPPHLEYDGERFHPSERQIFNQITPPLASNEDDAFLEGGMTPGRHSMAAHSQSAAEEPEPGPQSGSGNTTVSAGDGDHETSVLLQDGEGPGKKNGRTTEYKAGSLWYCCERVPAPTLLAWILQVIATLGWAVTTYMGVMQSKYVIGWMDEEALPVEEILIIVIAIATVAFGAIFLLVATFSSESLSRRSFNTTKKNRCGRYLNICLMGLCYAMMIFWLLICCMVVIPITVIMQLHFVIEMNDGECIDLESYGFSHWSNSTSAEFCGPELDSFWYKGQELLIIFSVAFCSALLVNMSLANMLICLSANVRHLGEALLETYAFNADDIHLNGGAPTGGMVSDHSHMDTSGQGGTQHHPGNNNTASKAHNHHVLTSEDISLPREAMVDLSDTDM